MKEEKIVRGLNNKAEIRKIAEEKVHILLSNRRGLLKLAALCITESIRANPEKYRHLIHEEDKPSSTDYTASEFNPFWVYGPSYLQPQHLQHNQSKVYFIEDYVAALTEDAEGFFRGVSKKNRGRS